MFLQPVSSQMLAAATARAASVRPESAALPADSSAVVTLSQAARALYAASTARETSSAAPISAPNAYAEFDTMNGTAALDIAQYFALPGKQPVDIDSSPLLAPTQRNIDTLTSYVSARMPSFLAENGIPSAPASITYDSAGEVVLPADYPYAAAFRSALEKDPGMGRALLTTAALSSHLVEMNKSIPFQQEYLAAKTQAEVQAVIAKYSYLFSDSPRSSVIALNFSAEGALSVTSDGEPISRA